MCFSMSLQQELALVDTRVITEGGSCSVVGAEWELLKTTRGRVP